MKKKLFLAFHIFILRAKRVMRDNPMGHLQAKGIDVDISPENLSKSSETDDSAETDYR